MSQILTRTVRSHGRRGPDHHAADNADAILWPVPDMAHRDCRHPIWPTFLWLAVAIFSPVVGMLVYPTHSRLSPLLMHFSTVGSILYRICRLEYEK